MADEFKPLQGSEKVLELSRIRLCPSGMSSIFKSTKNIDIIDIIDIFTIMVVLTTSPTPKGFSTLCRWSETLLQV